MQRPISNETATAVALDSPRLLSLDAFRGFVILAMIWVNYIAEMPDIPSWLKHASASEDRITLPDLVFPGFLFMVGMAIPLALHRQRRRFSPTLLGKLCWRAAGLITAGVVLANAYRYDASAALLPRALYFLLFYLAMMMIWRAGARQRWPFYAGCALMLFLLLAFRGQRNSEFSEVWLQPSWWGILGMIGWTYLVCSLIYLATRGERTALMAAVAGLVALYMGGETGSLAFLPDELNNWFNVPQLFGSTAANVLAGTVAGTLFVPDAASERAAPPHRTRLRFMTWYAAGLLACSLLLRPYHGLNKIHATESYTLVCAGVVLVMFILFYIAIDLKGWRRWSLWLMPAGANALFAYIVPDVWAQLAAILHLPRVWWPFLETGGLAGLLNAFAMAAFMMLLTAMANRAGLRLKF